MLLQESMETSVVNSAAAVAAVTNTTSSSPFTHHHNNNNNHHHINNNNNNNNQLHQSGFYGDSSEEELSVLPRHTKVVVTGNNRTKSVLVGLQGVVKKAVGLGGWHWLSIHIAYDDLFMDLVVFVVLFDHHMLQASFSLIIFS
ncbi:hypothetical protein PIB30_048157 [Stylosanthes scabra]|uniref:Uncharacterized protein n=1 Tax=Stylosanthes scabra TaxID=79078 RepID=A0ABU6VGE3_9FABA|nr:hypothetical protein [Stylosanthes scabra]